MQAGLKTVILPKRNEEDLNDLPAEVRNSINFVLVDRIDQAIEAAFMPAENSIEKSNADLDQIVDSLGSECLPVRA